ncbi:C3HC zinc finger-like-domain-containing protein [Biscogniauxia mediterranea]|nr:C3HC zinc finger-like-domain-containing protein [Biscogniauxia mediterranea]
MNATKRKFNALLQGIGSRSSPQRPEQDVKKTPNRDDPFTSSISIERPSTPTPIRNTPTATDMPTPGPVSPSSDFLGKRRRVGVLESTTPNQAGNNGTTISNIVLKKWTPGRTPSKIGKVESPKYCPGDRDELIRRLGTFQELTEWTPKPEQVNEIEWAKRGWVCQGKERVRCTLCNKELVVNTNKREAEGKDVPVTVGSDVEQALVKKFAELIIEAHQEDCLWRKRGCDDTLLRLALANPQDALASLRTRYDDLCTRPSFLPYMFNLRLPTNLDVQAAKSQLTPGFFTEPPPPSTNPSEPNDVALALALTGWQGLTNPRIGAVPNSASCATCLRRLALWMFKSKEVDEATGQVIVPAPMDHLDPVREHRFFCPWRNAAAQHNPGSKTTDNKTAWEVLAQTIKNNSYLRKQAEKSGSRISWHRPASSVPGTPSRPGAPERDESLATLSPGMVGDQEEEDLGARDAKDKERWARLRRVKSLFDTKNGKVLRRSGTSRPGTATSRPSTGHSRQNSTADDKSMTPKKP